MTPSASATWKVGPLAEAAGLTVRTLHYWDGIGLLSPSRRTAGGHREYTERDVARLYQVLALRELGLDLESIAICLEAGVDPVRVVRDHLAKVEASIADLQALRQRLSRLDAELAAELAAERAPDADTLLDALRATGRATGGGPEGARVLGRHLDADQLQVLRARTEAVGPAAHYLLEIEWPRLYQQAEALRAKGVDPRDARVGRLVARMDERGALFSGGDAAVSDGVRAAWHEDPVAMSGATTAGQGRAGQDERGGAWRELAAYLDRARRREPEPRHQRQA